MSWIGTHSAKYLKRVKLDYVLISTSLLYLQITQLQDLGCLHRFIIDWMEIFLLNIFGPFNPHNKGRRRDKRIQLDDILIITTEDEICRPDLCRVFRSVWCFLSDLITALWNIIQHGKMWHDKNYTEFYIVAVWDDILTQ